jgi:hypothetical protein
VAVGFAKRCPTATVYAYDIVELCQDRTRELAQKNGVADSVKIGGECTVAELNRLSGENSLVFCDCEGAEVDLIDPAKAPNLLKTTMIVEFHDHVRTDMTISQVIMQRFASSHDIEIVGRQSRQADQFPSLQMLPADIRPLAMHEDRMPTQYWAYFKPKAR